MAKRILYLVRHGQQDAEDGAAHGLGGHLTPLGRRQAELTARRLGSLPIETVHHSDLHRAVETAAIIAGRLPGVPVRAARCLRECVPCVPAIFQNHFARYPQAEMARDRQSAQKAYARYFKPARGRNRHELIVCHGNLIRYLALRVLGAPPELWANMDVHNCGISQVVIEPDRIILLSLNDTGHLPARLMTFW